MIIQRAIVSTDNNPFYYEFWPAVAKAWRNIGIHPVVAAVDGVTLDYVYGTVVNIPAIEGISNGFIAQVIRFIIPCFFPDEISITGDIDMIPLNRDYFTKQVAKYNDDAIIIFSADAYKDQVRYPMCYIAAKGRYFQEIIGLKSTGSSDIEAFIKKLHALNLNWDTDELFFSRKLHESPLFKKAVLLKRGGWRPFASNRIDRARWRYSTLGLCTDKYIDVHCLRPLDEHVKQLDSIFKYVDLGNDGSRYLKYLLKRVLKQPLSKMLLLKQMAGFGDVFRIKNIIPANGPARKKIIAFSLYGTSPRYTEKLSDILDSCRNLYPDWQCRIYIAADIIDKHRELLVSHNCEIVVMDGAGVHLPYSFWRFLAANDENAEAVIVRDLDSITTHREKLMVDEWMASDKNFHIIRDHVGHCARIMAGMWGIKGSRFDVKALTKYFLLSKNYGLDQIFLEKFIYPRINNSVMIHDRFPRYPDEQGVIVIPLAPGETYVGEVTTSEIYTVANRAELLQNTRVINLV